MYSVFQEVCSPYKTASFDKADSEELQKAEKVHDLYLSTISEIWNFVHSSLVSHMNRKNSPIE